MLFRQIWSLDFLHLGIKSSAACIFVITAPFITPESIFNDVLHPCTPEKCSCPHLQLLRDAEHWKKKKKNQVFHVINFFQLIWQSILLGGEKLHYDITIASRATVELFSFLFSFFFYLKKHCNGDFIFFFFWGYSIKRCQCLRSQWYLLRQPSSH